MHQASGVLAIVLAFLVHATPAATQALSATRYAPPPRPLLAPTAADTTALVQQPAAAAGRAPAWMTTPAGAFVSSLVVPGAGQAALGLRRWVLYGVAEVGLWAVRIDALGDESRFRGRYRDLAWDVARQPAAGERVDGRWGYYEAMSHYLSSGVYDEDPAAAGVQPETDPATYNGTVWDLARRLYLPAGSGGAGTPEYEAALAYYAERAAGPDFLWSWLGHEAELDDFRTLIERTDDAARRATRAAGLVLANHLVSAVDALVVARLRAEDDGVRLRSATDGTGPLPRWRLFVELPFPN